MHALILRKVIVMMSLMTCSTSEEKIPFSTLRARAHWPLCLATGGRVFVADPSTLG